MGETSIKYFLCVRCGIVFSEEAIAKANGKCPRCFADGSVLKPCTEDGKLLKTPGNAG
jgi:predicted Zn-ribbon and HTH transcriptional regulator